VARLSRTRDRVPAGLGRHTAGAGMSQWRVDLEAFELVLLRKPEDAPPYDDAELQRIQREHLAHHARLRESGQVVTNGPVADQPDTSLRGLAFYRTGSLEQSRQLAEADPAVRAGRLAIEIMTWYCPPGTMSKPGRRVSL
jgi:uncharacterized protein